MNISEKLTTIAENMQGVYDKGYSDGNAQGSNTEEAYNEGFEAGKKSQYDTFWDVFQADGKRTNYTAAFYLWDKSIFKPKYDILPTDASLMFRDFKSEIDMVTYLDNLGVILDFSACSNFGNFMLWSQISRMGVIDTRSATTISFYAAYLLKTIDLLILKDDGTQTLVWDMCNRLKNITIQGVIGKSCNMKDCPLSKYSIESVINALSKTTSKLTVTFKKTAINEAF